MKDKTILVVEDERPLMEAIKKKLMASGLEVVTARSATQAFGYFDDNIKIDAIWLDHYLIGKDDGLDFLARLKTEKSKYKTIPVFVVSNTASPNKMQPYLRLGAQKYYTKSDFRLDEIISEIITYLHQK